MSNKPSRRKFLKIAATAAASAAVVSVPGIFDMFSKESVALAAPNAATLQQNLSAFADLRFGMFNHFNLGTFTDEEWAAPNQSPSKFAPTAVNCAQWASAAVAAKMKFGILTCKHHDGFALWPTAYSSQCVTNAGSTAGKQDIVRLYTDAFRAAGLKIGLYYSIWDRTKPVQAYESRHSGIPAGSTISQANITYCLNQITELLTNYGTIDIFVNDGYAWQMGQQAIPYQQIRNLVKSLQPNCIMIDHGGLSQPYLGDAIYFEEPLGVTSPAGNTYASCQGQTISSGWFWHPSTPTTDPMSKASILSHLADLEPKYTSFILNCPPNRNGVLDTNIVNRLAEVGSSWNPNTSRASLPTQQLRAEYPVTPVGATATFSNSGEPPTNAIDGLSDKGYETCWSSWASAPTLPQSITIDLGSVYNNISTLEYLPKQWNRNNSTDGDITSFTIFVSSDGSTFTQVATGTWAANAKTKLIEWTNTNARYVKVQVNAAAGGYANVSEFRIGGRSAKPTVVGAGATATPGAINPYNQVEAETFSSKSGAVQAEACGEGGQNLGYIATGDYVVYNNVQFGSASLTNFQARIAGTSTSGKIDLRLDSPTGTLIGSLTGVNTGGWQTYTTASTTVSGATGTHNLYLVFTAGLNLNWFKFVAGSGPTPTPSAFPVPGAYYRLINRSSGKVLDVSGVSTADGANVHQWAWLGGANQQWQFVSTDSGYYRVVARHSGKVLDVSGVSTADGANVHQWTWLGGANQQWRVNDLGNGYYSLTARHSGKALEVVGSGTADGVNVDQWTWNSGNNQQWQIVP